MSEYLVRNRDQTELHIIACRLLLDIMPGLETSVVFQENVMAFSLHDFCQCVIPSYLPSLKQRVHVLVIRKTVSYLSVYLSILRGINMSVS